MTQRLFLIFYILTMIACNGSTRQDKDQSVDTTTKQLAGVEKPSGNDTVTSAELELRRKEFEEGERRDSIRFEKVMRRALDYTRKNKSRTQFTHEFEMTPDDSSFSIVAHLTYGHLFSNSKKHLLVRRIVPWTAICTIILVQDEEFVEVLKEERNAFNYISDTIRDVNGDTFKDFLVHWYASAGCCRRNTIDVCLYQPETGGFTSVYQFMNPTFAPEEGIIRGVGYGHPGEVGLYKYKWNNLRVDTVEFIYPFLMQKGQFIITKKPSYRPTIADGLLLKSLPKEYEKIESIDWFLDY